MRRRLLGLVLPALLAVLLVAAPAAADGAAAEAPVVLAAEAGEGADLGPDPRPREAEDNPATELGGYGDLDTPFTWAASFILLAAGGFGVLVMLGLYWLLVKRPEDLERAGQH